MLRGSFIEGGVLLPGRKIERGVLEAYSDKYIEQLVEWGMLEEVNDGRQVPKK